MKKTLKLATAQVRTIHDRAEAMTTLLGKVTEAACHGVDLILFPEVFIGGFPRGCQFGSSIGSHTTMGYKQYHSHFQSAVDLGDTPAGADHDWLDKTSPLFKNIAKRGDGTREKLEQISKETGVFIAVGVLERAGGTLYSSLLLVCPLSGVIGKRRKTMPTGMERLVWGQGSPSTLKAVKATIKGVRVTIAGALCWENWMPLLRQSLYDQGTTIYLAPTAHATEVWSPLMQTIAYEGKSFVLTSSPYIKASELPEWVIGAPGGSEGVLSRGGSMIVNPTGEIATGPLWNVEEEVMLTIDATLEDCQREKSDFRTFFDDSTREKSINFQIRGLD